MDARVLVVEDDEAIGDGIAAAMRSAGYATVWAANGRAALELAAEAPPDVVLLDLALPDVDGVEVCRELRSAYPETAILILTARREEIDMVIGLDAGADDYVTKPFRLGELLARVRAQLRRTTRGTDGRLVVGDLELDIAARRAWRAGSELELRPKEFDLLTLLVAEAGRVVSRERIMAEVWDEHWFGSTKTLDMHVSSLRRKLGSSDTSADPITTIRGVGYRYEQRTAPHSYEDDRAP